MLCWFVCFSVFAVLVCGFGEASPCRVEGVSHCIVFANRINPVDMFCLAFCNKPLKEACVSVCLCVLLFYVLQ